MNKQIIRLAVPVSIFIFLGYKLAGNWNNIKKYDLSINWLLFLTSLIVLDITVIFAGWIWKIILEKVASKKIGFKTALQIHIWSWLLRYIPGKISSLLGKIYLANKNFGVSKKSLIIVSAYEYTFLIIASFTIGSYAFLNTSFFIIALFLPIILLPFILPKIFYPILNRVPTQEKISPQKIITILPFYFINRAGVGAAFFLMASSITGLKPEQAFFSGSAYVLATIIGLLAIITPNGLGVREGALTIILSTIMSQELAITLAISSRAWSVLADILLVPILILHKKHLK